MTMKRRILSLALALFLVLALVPAFTTPAMAFGDTYATVSAGGKHSMAIKTDGSLWAWGYNTDGELGDGTCEVKITPVKIMSDVASVSAGAEHTMAIKTDGSLWGWGWNGDGELGIDSGVVINSSPLKIMDGVSSVSAGDDYTMAIKTDGSLWAWGDNYYGILGDGTEEDRYTPVKIMDSVASISAGSTFTMAIKTDGSLWAWGENYYGQLGDGTTENRKTPVKVMDSVVSVSSGNGHTVAIKTDGSLWAWGANFFGQFGDGTTGEKYAPVKIMDSVVSVSAYDNHTTAIKTDGSLWAWGWNENKQLGDGTQEDRHTPVKIMDGVASVSAGGFFNLAVKTDGSLWAWGNNEWGQIGDGTRTVYYYGVLTEDHNKSTPVKIMEGVKLPTGGTAISTPTMPSAEKPSSWAEADVTTAISAGLVPSSLQSNYTQAATRAEFCALAVALYENVTGGAIADRKTFDDTTDVNVEKAAAIGVVTGVGDNRFDPGAKLTREQAAVMLSRLAEAIGKPLASGAAAFADNGSISSWAIEGVGQVQAAGIMGGVGDNTFSPKTDYTREQSIVTILRLFDAVK